MLVEDLVKDYPGGKRAVAGLSFSVARGEVFGLLGPNGAGKTTTIGILTTRVVPTSGRVLLGGVDVVAEPSRARRRLAVVPQRPNLDQSLTVRQNLLFHGAFHGLRRAERRVLATDLLDALGLAGHADARVITLSGGQAQRVMIARALMHRPAVLFLDEPATGLDPQARLFVHERIADLSSSGTTVVVTTHDMEEAAKVSDRVGIVDHGTVLTIGTPAELTRALPQGRTVALDVAPDAVEDTVAVRAALEGMADLGAAEVTPVPDAGVLRVRVQGGPDAEGVLASVLTRLRELPCAVRDLQITDPNLEDVFLGLTGRELR
ncbi:ABC transporter ATP-binding protein [Actinomycetospora sp. OC33-EN08]|uniref:ABC transporter ATP-binding protein n=1 Tax=Actinomycetospora aurantiaca TaxID=3129233 RepID=A0ABU8MSX7_9PSEU